MCLLLKPLFGLAHAVFCSKLLKPGKCCSGGTCQPPLGHWVQILPLQVPSDKHSSKFHQRSGRQKVLPSCLMLLKIYLSSELMLEFNPLIKNYFFVAFALDINKVHSLTEDFQRRNRSYKILWRNFFVCMF